MLEKHSFSHPMHQRKNEIPKKKKTNNAYLMLQNHHQILEKDKLPMERERDGIEKNQYKVIKSR